MFNAAKAGHTGNLDPLADGLLPICFGEATKLSGQLLDADKTYVALARFGERTSTGDAEGEVLERSDPSRLDWTELDAVRERFVGTITQIPPMYSALKHEGQRLYALARAGQEIDRAPRQVRIDRLEWRKPEGEHDLEVTVRCSKGTYIRTLIEDLAGAIGQCAHLQALRRTEIHPFRGLPMWTFDDLNRLAAEGAGALDTALLPLSAAVRDWPQVRLDTAQLRRLARGQVVEWGGDEGQAREGAVAVLDVEGRLLALASPDPFARCLKPRRWLGGAGWLEVDTAGR